MLMEEDEIVSELRRQLKEGIIDVKVPRKRRIFVWVRSEAFKDAIRRLKDMGFTHISTITAVDLKENFEVIYHFAYKGSIELSLRFNIPKENPRIPTITDVIPGAILYEREVHDLFGIDFIGHPDLIPLILPENWPRGIYPLRKEYSLEDLRGSILKAGRDERRVTAQ